MRDMRDVIEELRAALPPIWAGPRSGELTGGAFHWPTIQNWRSGGKVPDECFVRSGPRVLVLRDRFLAWWESTLSEARPPVVPPRRGRRKDRGDDALSV
jgi:hypothetical protein